MLLRVVLLDQFGFRQHQNRSKINWFISQARHRQNQQNLEQQASSHVMRRGTLTLSSSSVRNHVLAPWRASSSLAAMSASSWSRRSLSPNLYHSHAASSSRRKAPSATAMAMILCAIAVVCTGPTAAQPQWRLAPPP
jgi:hypothetical protein